MEDDYECPICFETTIFFMISHNKHKVCCKCSINISICREEKLEKNKILIKDRKSKYFINILDFRERLISKVNDLKIKPKKNKIVFFSD